MKTSPKPDSGAVQAERFRRFVAVLELGERFPNAKRREPLPDLTAIWRGAAERVRRSHGNA